MSLGWCRRSDHQGGRRHGGPDRLSDTGRCGPSAPAHDRPRRGQKPARGGDDRAEQAGPGLDHPDLPAVPARGAAPAAGPAAAPGRAGPRLRLSPDQWRPAPTAENSSSGSGTAASCQPRPHVPWRVGWLVSDHVAARIAPDGPVPSLRHGGRAVDEDRSVCVGLDTHKAKIAVAVAEPGRSGEVRFCGEIANQPETIRRLIERLAGKHGRLRVCYEAGPCGYGLHRQITALGHDCTVVAPSLVPRKPGERVKTNRRDALTLARLHRAGELTAVWIPDPVHEAMRDLVRARTAAMEAVRRAPRPLH